MRARRSRVPLLARLSLLIAAACNLAVVTVGPRQHLALELASERAAAALAHPSSPSSHPPAKVPVHDESTCLLCHSLTAAALPAAGSGVLLSGSVAFLEAVEPPSAHARTSRHPTRARAPPTAIV